MCAVRSLLLQCLSPRHHCKCALTIDTYAQQRVASIDYIPVSRVPIAFHAHDTYSFLAEAQESRERERMRPYPVEGTCPCTSLDRSYESPKLRASSRLVSSRHHAGDASPRQELARLLLQRQQGNVSWSRVTQILRLLLCPHAALLDRVRLVHLVSTQPYAIFCFICIG